MVRHYCHIKVFLVLLDIMCCIAANTVGVYQSQGDFKNSSNSQINGLKFKLEPETNLDKGVTICGRFYYTRIIEATSILFYVKSMSTYEFLATKMGYQETFWGIADYNWILKDTIRDTFRVWAANRWHHICLALDKESSHFVVVKVGLSSNFRYVLPLF